MLSSKSLIVLALIFMYGLFWSSFCTWCEVGVQIHPFPYGYPFVPASVVEKTILGPLCVYAKSFQSCSTLCDPYGLKPTRLLCPWDSPGKNTGVGCYFLLQGIFLTKGSNLNLLSPALAGGFFTKSATWKCIVLIPLLGEGNGNPLQ